MSAAAAAITISDSEDEPLEDLRGNVLNNAAGATSPSFGGSWGEYLSDDEEAALDEVLDQASEACMRSAPVGPRDHRQKLAYVVFRGRKTGIFESW